MQRFRFFCTLRVNSSLFLSVTENAIVLPEKPVNEECYEKCFGVGWLFPVFRL